MGGKRDKEALETFTVTRGKNERISGRVLRDLFSESWTGWTTRSY